MQRTWEQNICRELNCISKEQKVPLARVMGAGQERSEIIRERDEAGKVYSSSSAEPLRFLFDCDDLLDAIRQIGSQNRNQNDSKKAGDFNFTNVRGNKSKNRSRSESGHSMAGGVPYNPLEWGMISLQLKTCSISQLRLLFSELHPRYRQIGIDDELSGDALHYGESSTDEGFVEMRTRLGLRLVESGSILETRHFAKRGIPSGIRPQLYQRVYGIKVGARDHNYFNKLERNYDEVEYLTDNLYRLDVHHTADNDNFFPFEEVLEKVMMNFSRDPWLADNCKCAVVAPMVGKTQDGLEAGRIPPSGVVPFCGLVWYATPLCYLFQDPEPIFFVLRKMFAEHWCHLNRIAADDNNSLINLCKLFEDLIQISDPAVVAHLGSLGLSPLEIAFSWIHGAFSDYLDVDQVLLLWDRIVGFNSLMLLPILAAAIISFRARELLHCRTSEEVFLLFEDPRKIKVLPLLQNFLFLSKRFDDDCHFVGVTCEV
jgi:hypothetical protein